jgi:hypothetical protein
MARRRRTKQSHLERRPVTIISMKIINDPALVLTACLTLGLAPFIPEPHLLGKIRWVAGGAIGMQPMDWFDLLLHGLPWILLLRLGILTLLRRKNLKTT